MRPSKLYIENFMCHEKSYIDFSEFNSALIVGKIENNELYSNGVGKTSIFKAIEYVLFNQADINLEKIIRDDTNFCQIVFDFFIEDNEYRVSRKRTKKGSTDLSLLQRTSNIGDEIEVYHTISNSPLFDKKFWKDISGRRAIDTEKELEKLIKINFKSFRGTVHFLQNDFSGLTTSTPEKRKAIFKDSLNLMVYSRLEKIAKDKANIIYKDLEKNKVLIESLGDVKGNLFELEKQHLLLSEQLLKNNSMLIDPTNNLLIANEKLLNITSSHKELENKSTLLLEKEKLILNDKINLENLIKEYYVKKASTIKIAKTLIEDIKNLKESLKILHEIDLSQIDVLNNKINEDKIKLAHFNIVIQNNILDYEELKIPIPDNDICKHCRQIMTDEHKKNCKHKILEDMKKCQNNISSSKKEVSCLNNEINICQQKLNTLIYSKRQLEEIINKISVKNKELNDKKNIHDEYCSLFDKFSGDLKVKENELLSITKELKDLSLSEDRSIQESIDIQKKNISDINLILLSINKEIAHLNASKAVVQYTIDQKMKDLIKLNNFENTLHELEKKYTIYPQVLQAFSSIGIPNLIIQNVLTDLQSNANDLLNQLKPGLQLSFFVEKIKDDGTEADTLGINYYINGKERYYEQLSGAMKLAVTFSLKLGLSFLLQDMIGTDIKFLLLDEIDQSLDKASVDAFADIVKFFQKDFTILIITHNDRLKDKFSHAILVEQDTNMVSRARVVNTW